MKVRKRIRVVWLDAFTYQRVELGSQRRNVFNRHFDALAVLLEVGGVPSVGIV